MWGVSGIGRSEGGACGRITGFGGSGEGRCYIALFAAKTTRVYMPVGASAGQTRHLTLQVGNGCLGPGDSRVVREATALSTPGENLPMGSLRSAETCMLGCEHHV